MGNMQVSRLNYQGHIIADKGEMLSLTDMWKAAGGDDAKRPANWARKDGADFIVHMHSVLNVPQGHIIKAERGKGGATFAHWQIGLAYAKYLSPEFHMWCNEVVRERMEGKSVSIATLSPEIIEMICRDDGISRQMNGKVTKLEKQIDGLLSQVNALIINTDARVAALEYVSVRELLEEAKAMQKRRGRVNRKIGYELRDRALLSDRPNLSRRCPHSRVWLFQRDFASLYMKERGNALVADHNSRQTGQQVIVFPVVGRDAH